MATINELKEAVRVAEEAHAVTMDALDRAREALRVAQAKTLNIAEGDIVRRKDKTYKVSDFTIWDFGREDGSISACLYGYKQLKGGGFGSQRRYIGSEFEKVEAAQSSTVLGDEKCA